MNGSILLAALFAAGAIASIAWLIIHPRRAPLRRIAPYTEVTRGRLGVPVETIPQPLFAGEAVRRLLGPLAATAAAWISRVFRVSDLETLELRLRQAGSTMTVEQYRNRHLRWAIITPVAAGLIGILLGSTLLVLLLVALGLFAGLRRMPDTLRAATRRRASRARSDLPTIAGLLSPRVRNSKSLVVAIGGLVHEGSGPVIDDLARALHATDTGVSLAAAFELIAGEAVDPGAARFYRFLGTATTGSIDLPQALLQQANELRTQRREEVERVAATRQISMVVPTLVLMVPVAMVFLLAPIPQWLFGH
jgi:tight adherence protein C